MVQKDSKPAVKKKKVTFYCDAVRAKEVSLVGDFNAWNPKKHPMKCNEKGIWQKSVILPPGKYEYKFIIDGKWALDTKNDQSCINEFGTQNNVIDIQR